MSDAAIIQLCLTATTIVGMIIGYLKLKNHLTRQDVATTEVQKCVDRTATHLQIPPPKDKGDAGA